MTDRHGTLVTIGDACRFKPDIREEWRDGTVRAVRTFQTDDTEARVDDGDPTNPDLYDNGFRVSAWVPKSRIEITEKP
jgi:hypothetical protein